MALTMLLAGLGAARADATATEVAYLLDAIRHSSCTFIRNGSNYDGPAAADHIQAKYEHFKPDIHSTEDFIDRAATKSLLSGEPYRVRCGSNPPMLAPDWLRGLLQSYRAGTPATTQ